MIASSSMPLHSLHPRCHIDCVQLGFHIPALPPSFLPGYSYQFVLEKGSYWFVVEKGGNGLQERDVLSVAVSQTDLEAVAPAEHRPARDCHGVALAS